MSGPEASAEFLEDWMITRDISFDRFFVFYIHSHNPVALSHLTSPLGSNVLACDGPSLQFIQQHIRLLQITRIEPLREPPIHRSQQFARLVHLALFAPEAREAHGGAKFPGFRLLLAGDGERMIEIRLRFRLIRLRRQQYKFPAIR